MLKLDPQAKALLDRVAAVGGPAMWEVSPVEARQLYANARKATGGSPAEVAQVENLSAPGPGGPIPLRYYRPHGSARTDKLPVIVFYHGGGWVVGDLDTQEVPCRAIANATKCAVVAVDYRLAPEHKFPAAAEDAIAATKWVAAHAEKLGVDASRLAVAGDSAGGNLAAVVALALRDAGGPGIAMQVLIYPVCDMAMDTPSYTENAQGYGLTRASMEWFGDHYMRSKADATDWRVAPLRAATHAGLPPAYIISAGFDPLRDDAHAYSEKLRAAGVEVTYECFEGMIHGFVGMAGVLAAGGHAVYRIAQQLRPVFEK